MKENWKVKNHLKLKLNSHVYINKAKLDEKWTNKIMCFRNQSAGT